MAGVADGSSDLTAVRHPLGFLCFPVLRGDNLGVCVHIWTEGVRAEPTTSPMHAHSWDLVSYVLYGTVRNDIIELTDGTDQRVFEVRSGQAGDELALHEQEHVQHRYMGQVHGMGIVPHILNGGF